MPQLLETLAYTPVELNFGTSGLRGLVADMADLECYINTAGFLAFLQAQDGCKAGDTMYLAGDLRDSTPRILRAVNQAIVDGGFQTVYLGLIPTPAVAYYALQQGAPCIMVTGSHIPADRNGIKFYKTTGEVLKEDEQAIKSAVAAARTAQYQRAADASPFDRQGMLRSAAELPAETTVAREQYLARYTEAFGPDTFKGKEIVFYQHSAVGRDLLVELLESLGAHVTPVGRSDVFVPIDTENVTEADQRYFMQLAQEHPGAFAIVSTDGDSDRPFVIDHEGVFHRGDVLGAVVAEWFQADFAAFPVSSSDAVGGYLQAKRVPWEHTKIGSPYVITAMQAARQSGKQRVVGWEVNGGFMLGCDMPAAQGVLRALPTRDAILPIIVALLVASQQHKAVADVFAALPPRFTQAGLIDNFPTEISREIVARFANDTPAARTGLAQYFTPAQGFGAVTRLNTLDGIRIFFDNGDIAHLRPSGNAPQLRIYSVANSQARADEIVALALAEPHGIFRKLQQALAA